MQIQHNYERLLFVELTYVKLFSPFFALMVYGKGTGINEDKNTWNWINYKCHVNEPESWT
jgi:hypothetical protein